MARHTQKIAARIPRELAEELDDICAREGLDNRSDAIRVCIEQYVEASRESLNTNNIILNVPNALLDTVDRCVKNGLARDRSEAIIIALNLWVNSSMGTYVKGDLELLEKKLAEISENFRQKKNSERQEKGLVR